MSARRSLRHSFTWAVAMTWGQRVLASGFTYVLAAILGPTEFGLVVLGLVAVELVQVVLEQGVFTALVQREDLERDHLDSAFWLSLAAGLLFAGATVAASGWWAGVNDAPELQDVVVALAPLLVIGGLMNVHMSLLVRETRFRALAVCRNVGALSGGVVGLGLALLGAGVWALVVQQVAMEAVALVGMWVAARWRPRVRFSWPHARDLIGFSASVSLAGLGGFVNRRADTLLMGLFFGTTAVGLYRLADRVVELVVELTMRPIGVIALPHFSRVQHDRAALRAMVEKCVRLTLAIAVPALLVVAATSEYLLALLGDEWVPAAGVLTLLCAVGIVKTLVYLTGPLLFAVARPLLRAGILWALGAVSVVAVAGVGYALADAAPDDQILGMAASRALLFAAVVLPVNLAVLVRFGGLRLGAVASSLPATVAAGLAAFGIVLALDAAGVLDGLAPLPAAVAAAGAATAAALASLLLLDPTVRSELRGLRARPGRPSDSD